MTLSSVRYSALSQSDDGSGNMEPENDPLRFGTDPDYFKSAFTYANYNDLDNMGYQAPKRHGAMVGNKYSRFTFSKDFDHEELVEPELTSFEMVVIGFSILLVILTMPFSLIFTLKFISSSEQLVVLRLGKARKPRGPGPAVVIPCVDVSHKIDTRVTAFNVPPLQVITIDRGLVEMGATVFLQVRDVVAAVCEVQDRNKSTRTLASTMLYRYISRKRICEISNYNERRVLGSILKDELGSFTSTFGVEITNVELSEVKVIKDGENMGMAALSAVAKSEVGQQLWSVIQPSLEEIAKEGREASEQEARQPTTDQPGCSTSDGDLIDISDVQIDVDHLITMINMSIDESLIVAVGKVFQINCDQLEPIYVDLKHGKGVCARGTAPVCDVVFEMSQNVFDDLLHKRIAPMSAYMNGSLKIKGSIQDALSLKYLAERVAHLL